MVTVRIKWSEISIGQPLEIVFEHFTKGKIVYGRYWRFDASFELGGKIGRRSFELIIPIPPFLRAFERMPTKDRQVLAEPRVLIRLVKLRGGKVSILKLAKV